MNEPQIVWNKCEYSHEKKSKKIVAISENKDSKSKIYKKMMLCLIFVKLNSNLG